MSKIKVRISETKFRSFYKTLILVLYCTYTVYCILVLYSAYIAVTNGLGPILSLFPFCHMNMLGLINTISVGVAQVAAQGNFFKIYFKALRQSKYVLSDVFISGNIERCTFGYPASNAKSMSSTANFRCFN